VGKPETGKGRMWREEARSNEESRCNAQRCRGSNSGTLPLMQAGPMVAYQVVWEPMCVCVVRRASCLRRVRCNCAVDVLFTYYLR
jgi:hypothetical protein